MKLNVCFSEINSELKVKFIESRECFYADLGEITIVHKDDYYLGPYIVTPQNYVQTLETKDKGMNNNVTIEAAPEAKAIVTGTLLELIGNFPIEVL